ncbi:MAG: CHRD domain-containing protein, partial [Pyrinomonadaceae bacterium]
VGVPVNAIVTIPAFTPGTTAPVVVTFFVPNPALPVDFTLRAASTFHAVFIRARCGATTAPCLQFTGTLTGTQEVPANMSSGTGSGTVVLNGAETMITVDASFAGLSAPAAAGHIHGPANPGVNAPVLFPFTGVPAATSGSIPQQVFAITPAQVAQLRSGLFYFNFHNATFPGGEIRGQISCLGTPLP